MDDARPLPDGPDERVERRASPAGGARVVRDTDLPRLAGYRGDLRLVITGGAGQLAGPVRHSASLGLELVAIDIGVRDLDDPAGNVRRVVAALDAVRDNGLLVDDTVIHVGLPRTCRAPRRTPGSQRPTRGRGRARARPASPGP